MNNQQWEEFQDLIAMIEFMEERKIGDEEKESLHYWFSEEEEWHFGFVKNVEKQDIVQLGEIMNILYVQAAQED